MAKLQPQLMKTFIAFLLSIASASVALGQGAVNFQNCVLFNTVDPTGGRRLVYDAGSPLDPVTGVKLAGTPFVAELYAGGDANSLTPVTASISQFRSTTSSSKGCWAATGISGPNDRVLLPGFAA